MHVFVCVLPLVVCQTRNGTTVSSMKPIHNLIGLPRAASAKALQRAKLNTPHSSASNPPHFE
ncbi:hypothetical protein PF005_g15878 [Phytophthora fragariae]|uniref:RxLR effector protein n=1 Tax=Phytophthora fragariae TaxID=53985 RepID=A0A6A3JVI4_9STRA|nr:hypothetical protein PF003_g3439 [Phytophthora fragariae]KAE8938356.1 hypothetical protein PF009_g11763 [Phytophthora fragariae]KAE8999360.1 hypothetical protein PF011_g14661 [Phytophthora fragariae]KAE9098397.1 hypothetical protein PF010_g15576 [Phytophthora fragariae]KAE9111696.1 hypothetical protein PF007_g11381 [Phytophthora fragariae]